MKRVIKFFLLLLLPVFCCSQQRFADSLKNILSTTTDDFERYKACLNIYNHYEESNRDTALVYINKMLILSRKHHEKLAEAFALISTGYQSISMGRYSNAYQVLLQAFAITENPKNDNQNSWPVSVSSSWSNKRLSMLSYAHHVFAILMWQTDNKEQEIIHFKEARRIGGEINHTTRRILASMNLGRAYLIINKPDSALFFETEAEKLALDSGLKKYLGQVYAIIANVYLERNNKSLARQYYYRAIQISIEQDNRNTLSSNYFVLTRYYLDERAKDSAIKYAMLNLSAIRVLGPVAGRTVNIGTVYENIYLAYQLSNQHDSIFKYQGLTLVAKDSLSKIRIRNLTDFQTASFQEMVRLQNLEKEKVVYQSKIRTYALLVGLGVFLLIALILYRNNRQKQKSNKVLEKTLSDLKSTQSQLIQSEKMASLGELTAGIAHEIQNPLNFVNNFSELNAELIDELQQEADKGNLQDIKAIAKDIKDNEEKINHHGKRADAIVKGMLQHSRSSSGVKEPTDINALTEEYIRLCYHGLRAKDKSFNATIKTDLDKNVGNINLIPQDIGRVILNLLTNAFYVVNEKKRQAAGSGYEPTVSVSTKKINGKPDSYRVEIRVADNGNGIPDKILEKIFQPFFTTKPTGQGTGLGLSLSYDIVTKGHGGSLKVETTKNTGTSFIIELPAS